MRAERKVTVILPEKLLKDAIKASGEGITPTLKKGLELVAAKNTYESLSKLQGKYKNVDFDLESSRRDRDE